MRLKGALAVVTGASSGIGAATAEELARRGVSAVALVARNRPALDAVAARVGACGARAHVYQADLSELAQTLAVASRIQAELGAPTLLVNNAGAGRWLFTEGTSAEEALDMMMVPYGAAFAFTRAFLPDMLQRGTGHIVNLSSPACFIAWPGASAYSAARWAMRGFSEALEADLHGTGVGVSLVVPGKVSSQYFANNPGSEQRIPSIARLFRTLAPAEVAKLIARAVERRQRLVIRPWLLNLTVHWSRWFPRSLRLLLRATGAKRER
jgi:short-subunit dehydrogenase